MSYSGRCACGAVKATMDGDPVGVAQCWCRQCQQIAAGGPTTNAVFQAADVSLNGELATHQYTTASGNTGTQSFCPSCGTAVMGESSLMPDFRAIRLGFLDAGHGLTPGIALWTEEAPAGASIDPAIQQLPRQ